MRIVASLLVILGGAALHMLERLDVAVLHLFLQLGLNFSFSFSLLFKEGIGLCGGFLVQLLQFLDLLRVFLFLGLILSSKSFCISLLLGLCLGLELRILLSLLGLGFQLSGLLRSNSLVLGLLFNLNFGERFRLNSLISFFNCFLLLVGLLLQLPLLLLGELVIFDQGGGNGFIDIRRGLRLIIVNIVELDVHLIRLGRLIVVFFLEFKAHLLKHFETNGG